ncbi:hypothetical protein AQI88_38125 [Streptomyces cellostaticus]|uniref:Uncharacterized protein n=1 Tax=Streptomyces cellostaticus TaxID=67285 RepID=A0A117PTK2_9ACTN|nr:hypothetical protein AQI88_38125 [Streptomyces cellostaticus]GHI03560.1 hypothetical protein Scel_18810 [Streptomyces cellostaticus]
MITASPLPPKTSTDDRSTRIRSFTLPFVAFRGAVRMPGKALLKSTAPERVRSMYNSCVVVSYPMTVCSRPVPVRIFRPKRSASFRVNVASMSSAWPSAAEPIRGCEVFVTVTSAAVAADPSRSEVRFDTGSLVSRMRPSMVRRAVWRGMLCAPRQGEVGMDVPYSQSFIQPILYRLSPGTFSQDTAA